MRACVDLCLVQLVRAVGMRYVEEDLRWEYEGWCKEINRTIPFDLYAVYVRVNYHSYLWHNGVRFELWHGDDLVGMLMNLNDYQKTKLVFYADSMRR